MCRGPQFEGTVDRGREGMVAGGKVKGHTVFRVRNRREINAGWSSDKFYLELGMVPPTFRVGLLSLVKPL